MIEAIKCLFMISFATFISLEKHDNSFKCISSLIDIAFIEIQQNLWVSLCFVSCPSVCLQFGLLPRPQSLRATWLCGSACCSPLVPETPSSRQRWVLAAGQRWPAKQSFQNSRNSFQNRLPLSVFMSARFMRSVIRWSYLRLRSLLRC